MFKVNHENTFCTIRIPRWDAEYVLYQITTKNKNNVNGNCWYRHLGHLYQQIKKYFREMMKDLPPDHERLFCQCGVEFGGGEPGFDRSTREYALFGDDASDLWKRREVVVMIQ